MRTRALAIGVAMLALVCSAASAGPFEDVHIGPAVTIQAPNTYSSGVAFTVSGMLNAVFALPIVVEVAVPVPDQRIDVLVDDAVAASAVTAQDGSYSVQLTFGSGQPTTRAIRAVAFRGSALETSSRTVVTSIDHFPIELDVVPANATIGVASSIDLTAMTTDDLGRDFEVTDQASWSSSDPAVASVSNDPATKGRVSGSAPGTATITAIYEGQSATATVTVE